MELQDSVEIRHTEMKKEEILQRLREHGCRVTRQRKILLDIILEGNCVCCKELYYRVSKVDPGIGIATVYRMVNTLIEIGALHRGQLYEVAGKVEYDATEDNYHVYLDDGGERVVNRNNWREILTEGMKACGMIDRQEIRAVIREEQNNM